MPKKYKTLRSKLRERVKAEKPIRTYKRREPGEEKTVYTVTKESYEKRHEFCFNAFDMRWELEHTPGATDYYERHPEQFNLICNHPEDGLCVKRPISDEELRQINERLGGRKPSEGTSQEREKDLENPVTESKPRRRRRSSKEKPPAQYFCLKCDKPHIETEEIYDKHIGFKRGRGRPPKK